jgi:hypothetical protein
MNDDNALTDRKPYIERLTEAAIKWFTGMETANLDFVGYEAKDGARLFKEFTQRHEPYYPYRKEVEHIKNSVKAIDEEIDISGIETFVVVGQGPWDNCSEKEGHILRHALNDPDSKLKKVKFIDLSAEFNREAFAGMTEMVEEHNRTAGDDNQVAIEVETYEADFERLAKQYEPDPKSAVFSTGSTITNLDNRINTSFPQSRVKEILSAFRRIAGPEGSIVIGYDGNMDQGENLRAYHSIELSHFFYNMVWEMHQNAEGLSLQYMNAGGQYEDITKEKLMAGEIVTYQPEWNGQQILHKLVFVTPVELKVDFENPELSRIADEINGRDMLNGGLHFETGDSRYTMVSGKFSDQQVSKASKRAGIIPGKVIKEGDTGLCLHAFRVPADDDSGYNGDATSNSESTGARPAANDDESNLSPAEQPDQDPNKGNGTHQRLAM